MKIDGKDFQLTPAGFEDAMTLQVAIGKALKGNKIDLSGLSEDLLADIDFSKASGLIETLINLVLSVSTSSEISDCLFKCLARSTFGPDKLRVDKSFFEDVENRKFYYPIMIEVIKVNVGPFFGGVGSLFSGIQGKITSFLKQK